MGLLHSANLNSLAMRIQMRRECDNLQRGTWGGSALWRWRTAGKWINGPFIHEKMLIGKGGSTGTRRSIKSVWQTYIGPVYSEKRTLLWVYRLPLIFHTFFYFQYWENVLWFFVWERFFNPCLHFWHHQFHWLSFSNYVFNAIRNVFVFSRKPINNWDVFKILKRSCGMLGADPIIDFISTGISSLQIIFESKSSHNHYLFYLND